MLHAPSRFQLSQNDSPTNGAGNVCPPTAFLRRPAPFSSLLCDTTSWTCLNTSGVFGSRDQLHVQYPTLSSLSNPFRQTSSSELIVQKKWPVCCDDGRETDGD